MSDSTAEALPEALVILLQQQCCLSEQGVVCRLLATSKSLHSLILANCTGRVHIRLTRAAPGSSRRQGFNRPSSCATWLAKCGSLIDTLSWDNAWLDPVSSAKQMADLLKAAAANPRGLHLPSFEVKSMELDHLPDVLQQLPAASLTHLGFVVKGSEPDPDQWADDPIYTDADEYELEDMIEQQMMEVINHDTPRVAAALKSFTELQSLELISHGSHLRGAVLEVLPQLTSLTKLTLESALDATTDVNDRLPPHLQELELICIHSRDTGSCRSASSLKLGHFTALTRLHTSPQWFDVAADDVLPPNLHTLCVSKVASVKPLLPLTGLRKLTVARLPAVADIAAAIATAGREASNGSSKDSEQAAAAALAAGAATSSAPAAAGGSFEDRTAQLQLLLPGLEVKRCMSTRPAVADCWCCDSGR